ncbi:PREDICTED: uncharacterized protein LOC104744015 [Camelina sativa]|uniref:Uncharacterized protein LOC104744015 n=1 Tax=Camelina sativa TaxID=90675 RepID=A0ABM0VZ04_CAMSA|nr:PREDICTED: uncharacterized protein LOC104744015 [Camelina sativa]
MIGVNISYEDGKKKPNTVRKTMEKLKSVFDKKKPNHHEEDSSQTSPYLTKALNEDISYELFKIQQKLDQKNFILQKQDDIRQGQEEKMKNLTEESKENYKKIKKILN